VFFPLCNCLGFGETSPFPPSVCFRERLLHHWVTHKRLGTQPDQASPTSSPWQNGRLRMGTGPRLWLTGPAGLKNGIYAKKVPQLPGSDNLPLHCWEPTGRLETVSVWESVQEKPDQWVDLGVIHGVLNKLHPEPPHSEIFWLILFS
jgi:hypothetical protein